MNSRIQLWCVWAGPAAVITYGIAFWAVAQYMPPHTPMLSPEALAELYDTNRFRIQVGMLLCLIFSTLFFPWFAVISVQIARIEGRFPVLAVMQFGGATLLMVFFYLCSLIWISAAYRPDIDPQILRLMHESSWLMFVMAYPEYVMMQLCIAVAGFRDKSADPIFPRWFCYFCLWVGFSAIGGGFAEFFYRGPFAWNGLFGFWLPVAMFVTWIFLLAPMMAGHIRRQARQAQGTA